MLWIAAAHQSRPAGPLDRHHEPLYDAGLLTTPTHTLATLHGRGPGHAAKGLSLHDDTVLVCLEREIVTLDRATWRETARWSHRHLNDVHHAIHHDGALWVASTGADAILEVRGDEVTTHTLAAPLPNRDLREVSLKPHRVHPNHLFVWQDAVWVTRLMQGDALCLQDRTRRIHVDEERIHDGLVHDGRIWFTTVDGRVVSVDGAGDRQVLDLNDGQGPLGWCRGLAFDDGLMWVGFTRLRATRWRRNLAWVRGKLRGRLEVSNRPTRLLGVELGPGMSGQVVRKVELESRGVDAVFGLDAAQPS